MANRFKVIAENDFVGSLRQFSYSHCIADIDGNGRSEIILAGGSDSDNPNRFGYTAFHADLRIIDFEHSGQLNERYRETWNSTELWSTTSKSNEWRNAYINAVIAVDIFGSGLPGVITCGGANLTSLSASGDNKSHSNIDETDKGHLRHFIWDNDRNKLVAKGEALWVPPNYDNAGFYKVCAADIDGDGNTEIICVGAAWNGKKTENSVSCIAIFDAQFKLKGYKTWAYGKSLASRAIDLAVADADSNGQLELITLGYATDSENVEWATQVEGELIAWNIAPTDSGLRFTKKAEAQLVSKDDYLRPRSLWVGELNKEAGIDIVVGGVIRYSGGSGPHRQSAAMVRVWRLTAFGNFVKQNEADFIFLSGDDYNSRATLNDCMSVHGADIKGDGNKKLLITVALAGTNQIKIGCVVAFNNSLDLMNTPKGKLVHRDLTFGVVWSDGSKADLMTRTISTADLAGDGNIRTVVSGFFSNEKESRDVVFIFGE
jgi:hypothetical protein